MTGAQDYSPLSTAKAALRREIIARRDALDAATRTSASHRITGHILTLECFQRARCVLAYASMGSEFYTSALLSQVMAKKKLALPTVDRVDKAARTLQLYFVQNLETDLQPGVWGIREPRADCCVPAPLDEIDLVLAPGVAFTQRGERLGYGGGYYDQLLARFLPRPVVIAAAFAMQMVADLPSGATDLPVDYVITENTVYAR
jgi:5-formyltetrahydrofolate cyclo-ligase